MAEGSLMPNMDDLCGDKKRTLYQAMVGSLMFAMVETRPDIAFAVSIVSRHSQNPGQKHFKAVQHILRYLNGTKDLGITYGGDFLNLEIVGYSDSDWAGEKLTRKSTSGFIFMLNGGPVSWASKRQSVVALSSTEAEYIALTQAAKEATWFRLLLTELRLTVPNGQITEIHIYQGGELKNQIKLKGDNQSAIALANNPVFHDRSKHIDIIHHYIRDEVLAGRINLSYIPITDMVADGLTKPLGKIKFARFIGQMGMT